MGVKILTNESNDADPVEKLALLQDKLGYRFRERSWLIEALTHSSKRSEDVTIRYNERLEFLGDSVLNHIISERLFDTLPEAQEGTLTEIRKCFVGRETLLWVGLELGLSNYLYTGKSLQNNGDISANIICDATEALIGAIFKDGGIGEAESFIFRWIWQDQAQLAVRPTGLTENHNFSVTP